MNSLLHKAMVYSEKGLSVIATDALKQSIVKWADLQEKKAEADQISQMFNHPDAHSIAVITGSVSGNLEVVDIDSKYDLRGKLLERLFWEMEEFDDKLEKSLVIAQSRSGGYHLYYRCSEIGRNQPLARRPVTEEEKERNPKEKVKVLIETRGEGGYIIVPPSPGYSFIQHDFSRIPQISPSQRDLLLRTARFFNEVQQTPIVRYPPKPRPAAELSPLDDYNLRGDIIGLLQKHGWTVVRQNEKRTWFKRPGDSDKRSSGDYNHDLGLFSVFSTSTEFESGRGYLPYAVYAVLECGGDFKETVRKLSKEGYGDKNQSQRKSNRYFIKR